MTKHMTPFDTFNAELSERRQEFAALLPSTIPHDLFVATAITAVKQNPDLLQVERRSLHQAITKCAQDGLLPDARHAVIVPFKTKGGTVLAGYIPMYQGIILRAHELGEISPINAQVVREHDLFEHEEGDAPRIVHRFPKLGQDRGKLIGAYAVFWRNDKVVHREVMDIAAVEKVRSVSRAKDSGPWVGWYEEMARIRPIRRGSKYVPMGWSLRRIIEREDEIVDFSGDAPAPTVASVPLERPAAITVAQPLKPLDVGFDMIEDRSAPHLNGVPAGPAGDAHDH